MGSLPALRRPRIEESMFGFERFARVAGEWAERGRSAEAVADGMWAALHEWCGGDFQHDDVTLVVLRVKAPDDPPSA